MLLYQTILFLQSSLLNISNKITDFIFLWWKDSTNGKKISDQIEALEAENQKLKYYEKIIEKLFDKMVKTDLGMDLKSIRKILENHNSFKDNFIKKIADFYGLETEADYQDFLDTFCTNEFINHYNSVENPESDN